MELNITERFFAAELGAEPLLFRPPYSIDQEPDTGDEVRPLEIAQEMGYITVGDRVRPERLAGPTRGRRLRRSRQACSSRRKRAWGRRLLYTRWWWRPARDCESAADDHGWTPLTQICSWSSEAVVLW